jgi:Icc-related predicted phosphoesterase
MGDKTNNNSLKKTNNNMESPITVIGIGAAIIGTMIAVVKYLHALYQAVNAEKVNEIKTSNGILLNVLQQETKDKFSMLEKQINANEVRCAQETKMLMDLWKETKEELTVYKNEDKKEVFSVVNNLAIQIGHLSDVVEKQNQIVKKL